jgi:hypothetical protein
VWVGLLRSMRRLEGLIMCECEAVSRSEPCMLARRGECRDLGEDGSEETVLLDAGSRNLINGFVIIPNTC